MKYEFDIDDDVLDVKLVGDEARSHDANVSELFVSLFWLLELLSFLSIAIMMLPELVEVEDVEEMPYDEKTVAGLTDVKL